MSPGATQGAERTPREAQPRSTAVPSSPSGGEPSSSIAERVASCGGSLTVGPAGRGFAVTARLPAS